MSILEKFKFTNYKSKYAKLILPLLSIFPNKIKNHGYCLYNFVKEYHKINVLASGPSLNKISLENEIKEIYLTTNSSYLVLDGKKDFIHVINDHGYLIKFLLFGLKYKPKLVIIFIHTSKVPSGLSGKILSQINNFLYRVKKDYPIIISNPHDLGVCNNRNYWIEIKNLFNMLNTNIIISNSGFLIYVLSITIIEKHKKNEVNVYGIDAGEGGNKHYDGRPTSNNHVAFRDKNKEIMGDFFELCQTKYPTIKNYSYFKNNTDK